MRKTGLTCFDSSDSRRHLGAISAPTLASFKVHPVHPVHPVHCPGVQLAAMILQRALVQITPCAKLCKCATTVLVMPTCTGFPSGFICNKFSLLSTHIEDEQVERRL